MRLLNALAAPEPAQVTIDRANLLGISLEISGERPVADYGRWVHYYIAEASDFTRRLAGLHHGHAQLEARAVEPPQVAERNG